MKKFVALLLVVVMVGALGAVALADAGDALIDAIDWLKTKSEFKTFAIFNIIFEGLKNIFDGENGIFAFVQEFVNRIKFKNILNMIPSDH